MTRTCHRDGNCRCDESLDTEGHCSMCGSRDEHCACGCTCEAVPLIITRHHGAVEWLAARGIEGEAISHADPEDVRGRVIYGVLPLHLAAEAAEVWSIDLPDLLPEDRGRDLSAAEMDTAGARLVGYRIRRI